MQLNRLTFLPCSISRFHPHRVGWRVLFVCSFCSPSFWMVRSGRFVDDIIGVSCFKRVRDFSSPLALSCYLSILTPCGMCHTIAPRLAQGVWLVAPCVYEALGALVADRIIIRFGREKALGDISMM